jgi:hypothetical protein
MKTRQRFLLGGAAAAVAFALAAHAAPPAQQPVPIPPAAQGAPAQVPAVAGMPPAPATVKITIVTVPQAKKVFVNWGKKRLGVIAPRQPLIVQRPRDSGPLDLIVTSEGYIPVQTRAFTFADSKLSVKLTPVDQKNTLLGYREEVPAAAPDAGAPPAAPAAVSGGLPPSIAAPPVMPAQPPMAGRDAGAR